MPAAWDEEAGAFPRLQVPATKALPYFEWQAVKGRELTLRPLGKPHQLREAEQAHQEWRREVDAALKRAFFGWLLAARFSDIENAVSTSLGRNRAPHDVRVSVFCDIVAGELGVLDRAITAARTALTMSDANGG